MKTFFEYLKERKKEKEKENNLLNKKYNSLTLEQRNAYEQIIDRREGGSISLYCFFLIPKTIFYLLVLGFMMTYLLGQNFLESFKIVCISLLKIWIWIVMAGLIADIINITKGDKLKKQLLKGVKS